MINRKKSYLFLITLLSLSIIALIWQLNTSNSSLNSVAKKHLNQQEIEWLQNLKEPLKVGITHIPNQIILKEHTEPTGFSMDIFYALEKELHIHFSYHTFQTWDALIAAIKNGEIDIVFLAQKSKERLAFLDFTDTILTQQNKIIVKSNNHRITTIDSLMQKKVAIVKGSALYGYITVNYPNIKLIPVKTELEALTAVTENKADATISEPVRASYYMEIYNLKNLRVSGDFKYNYNLRIANRNSSPILSVILSKAVDNLSLQMKEALYLKWGYVKDKERYFDSQTLIYLTLIFGIVLPFSLYLFFINLSLEKEVQKRKYAENNLKSLNIKLEERVDAETQKRREHELHMLHQNRFAQMGNMMNMIAHQWKQPLNVLSALNLSLTIKYNQSKLNDEFMHDFDTNAQKQIDEMTQVIHNFMDYFKPKHEVKLNTMIEDTLNIVKPSFSANDITIKYSNHMHNFQAQYNQALGQAIINILHNAKDALIEKNIKNKIIIINLQQEKNQIVINIEDNAGGIPKEIIDKIFDPYFSTRLEKNGTGLGLYMSKIIVENHCEGLLKVSNSNHGAIFTIILH